jgi:hypothetical protein
MGHNFESFQVFFSKHGHILILLKVHAQMGGPIWVSCKPIMGESTLHCP